MRLDGGQTLCEHCFGDIHGPRGRGVNVREAVGQRIPHGRVERMG